MLTMRLLSSESLWVTQMGSSMRPTVFNDRVAAALKTWHHAAKKQSKHGKNSESHVRRRRADRKLPLMACRLLISFITTAAALLLKVSRTLQGFQITKTLINGKRKQILYMINYELHESVHHGSLDVRDQVTQNQDPISI
ncbi:MLO protein [Salix suchowensis]|nr:MLO protein [Salix suchowensis]